MAHPQATDPTTDLRPATEVTARLLEPIATKQLGLPSRLRYDPEVYLLTDTSVQAAVVRRAYGLEPLPEDGQTILASCDRLATHIRDRGCPSHESFQKGYGEFLLLGSPALRGATIELIEQQWVRDARIGHYELFSALLLDYPEWQILRPTCHEILHNLQSWNDEGWCPWTPALWMRILWLARGRLDADADLDRQIARLEAGLSAAGQFQDREPFCLMYSLGLMNHPGVDAMLERFFHRLHDDQRPNGGWGELSYIAFLLLKKWDLLEALTPTPPDAEPVPHAVVR